MLMLETKSVIKRFEKTEVLHGIDFSINKGEVVSIIGPSGSGKSTFLRCICCLERIDGGNIAICGNTLVRTENGVVTYAPDGQLNEIRRHLSLVFQNFNLFPHLNVLENITLAPVQVLKIPVEQANKNAKDILQKMGLSGRETAYPFELSGGQAQRVAIARSLAMNPDILCFDEPTSALDPELTGEVIKVIRDLAKEKITMIIVTHEMGFASELSDKVLFFDEGSVIAEGSPDEIFRNSNEPRVQAFLAKLTSI